MAIAVGFDLTDAAESGDASITTSAGDAFDIANCCLASGNELFFGLVNETTAYSEFSLFNGGTFDGWGIDRIYLTQVPVPPAGALFATGLVMLGFLGWRRRKSAA
jgi:hypothetical protein